MKGFPANVEGPLGPWMKKLTATVARVRVGHSLKALIRRLGEPDETRREDRSSVLQVQDLMEQIAGGPSLIQFGAEEPLEEILVYSDPYRRRQRYLFGVLRGRVAEIWQEQDAVSPPAPPDPRPE